MNFKDGNIENAIIDYADGTSYSGECDFESLTGTGTMKFTTKDKYVGSFSNGMREGSGVYTWKSGDKYDGEWKQDAMSGSGTYTYADGNVAKGTFKDNKFDNGTYTVKNDFGKYDFTITNGKATAVSMKLKSGTTYEGDIKDGKLTGTAQIKYSNGDKYSGRVVKGVKSGQGVYKWKNGASYDGQWKKDEMNGTGIYMYSSKEKGYKLTGKFKNGQPTGSCQYYESTTKCYKTDWSNGRCVKIYE